jgi:hypothetical protein
MGCGCVLRNLLLKQTGPCGKPVLLKQYFAIKFRKFFLKEENYLQLED